MTIEFQCECGAPCSADEAKVGQLYHCEACGLDIPVPLPAHAKASLKDVQAQIAQPGAAAEMVHQIQEAHPEVAAAHGDPDKRKADRAAFQAQLGQHAGAAELLEQIHGIHTAPPSAPAAPSDAAPADAAPAPTAEAGAPAARPAAIKADLGLKAKRPAARPPTGKERAAKHIGFKRVMWLPALLIGLVCAALGVHCFLPHAAARYPERRGFGADWQIVLDAVGNSWAIPPGAKAQPSKTGRMFYLNDAGYEEAAVDVNDYVRDFTKAQQYEQRRDAGYLGFGIGLLLVAVALVVFSMWMWYDVRLVGPKTEPEGEGEAPVKPVTAAEAKPAAEDTAEKK